ncbi:hypothetical protein XFF6166_160002 [Xanthomonas citri pv. fuscans]|nr:hypothetical protein XFF6166_160002 [Xanthomonas citri pv. fuscans]SON98992.1 hypothetical protein XFF6960_110021 [Xanthomonas citri pv. fuscans]SOO04803.1 hypothetical protein XFF7767_310021 [Xanthomonas citri pv. fuscans]SOO09553.1 hypothetical protein XFF6970_40037 [Xanthomonas citri pv. fuscans]SOO14261.1 hypothetical protein XFF7766_290040 [Xanthomonas citri pv. fuscans]
MAAWRHILLNGHYTFQSSGKIIDLDALVAGLELGYGNFGGLWFNPRLGEVVGRLLQPRRLHLSLAKISGFDALGCRPLNRLFSPFLHDADPVVRVANLDVSAGVQQLAAVAVQYKSFVLNVQLAAGLSD